MSLNRRGIPLALEYGVLTKSSQCGTAVEGFGGETLLNAASWIRRLGGTMRYLEMDEPIYYGTPYTGTNACQWTVDQTAANGAANIHALMAQFPNVIIDDEEPFPLLTQPGYRDTRQALRPFIGPWFLPCTLRLRRAMGQPNYLAGLSSVHNMLISEGIPFGIIYNGNSTDTSNAQWIQSATQHMISTELSLGAPDRVMFQSWHAHPNKLIPEADPDSFTSLIDTYSRGRTALSASINGSTLLGKLVVIDTGEPVHNARSGDRNFPGSDSPRLCSGFGGQRQHSLFR